MINDKIRTNSFAKQRPLIKLHFFCLVIVFFLISGCKGRLSPHSNDFSVAAVNGDVSGNFYSLSVLHRYEPGFNAETARGKEIYLQKCSICHGESGDGGGFNAYNLKTNFNVQPFNFTDITDSANVTFIAIQNTIAHGGGAVGKSLYMPPWSATLSDYDIDCVARYIWQSLMKKRK